VAKKKKAATKKKATKTKTKKVATFAHGRKAGPKGEVCGTCRWIDAPNEALDNPPGIGCRLGCGVNNRTQCCKEYEGAGVTLDKKVLDSILKTTKGRRIQAASIAAASCVTSGLLTSDLVTGGGIAPGRVHVKAGKPHSGKTTEYAETLGDCLFRGIPTYHFDAEGAVDWDYTERALRKRGVEMTWNADQQVWEHPSLYLVDFNSGDAFFKFMAKVLRALPDYTQGPPQVAFICDSAANLTPEMLDDDPNKNPMAAQARMFSLGFQIMRSRLKRAGGILCFTNHIKEKPGVVFGSPEYMSGGTAIHHHADIIEWMRGRASGMPHPAVKKKGRRVERSWTGEAKDFFVYAAHAFKKNRRRGSAVDITWGRICFKEAGGAGTGVDLAYDVFQFLCMTGQAEWDGRERISLYLHKPVVKNGEVKHPKLRGWYDKSMAWVDFRSMVYEELHTPGTHKLDLYNLCRMQMHTGWAFNRFRSQTQDDE